MAALAEALGEIRVAGVREADWWTSDDDHPLLIQVLKGECIPWAEGLLASSWLAAHDERVRADERERLAERQNPETGEWETAEPLPFLGSGIDWEVDSSTRPMVAEGFLGHKKMAEVSARGWPMLNLKMAVAGLPYRKMDPNHYPKCTPECGPDGHMLAGDMKVVYMTTSGNASTAYITGAALCERGCHQGFDKHTDASVNLRWDGRQWVESPRCPGDNGDRPDE